MKNARYSIKNKDNRLAFRRGMVGGIPICLGYLAVGFSLGIAACNAGMDAAQSYVVSFFCKASAGEYAGFTTIAAGATLIELALITFIANARYLLMSCALSQRMAPDTPIGHRVLVAFDITDELFSLAISQEGYLNPYFSYGAALVAGQGWAIGTMLGNLVGSLLPLRLVSAFSVALYGMFLAAIIPPAKKSRVIAVLIVVCFGLSYAAANLPVVSELSDGMRTIILTVVIASAAAILFPKKDEEEEGGV